MHTPTTGKIAALLAVQKPEISPNESSGAGDAFGRMLNQQIADRRAADNAARTSAAARPAKPAQQAKPADPAKATDPAKPAEAQKPAAAGESNAAASEAAGAQAADAAESSEERADAAVVEDTGVIPPSIASMLALAANRLSPEASAGNDAKTGTQAGIAAARTAPDGAVRLATRADADDLRAGADAGDGDIAADRFAAALGEAGERTRTAENASAGRMLASATVADNKADPAMLTAVAAPASQVGFDATLAATGRTADRLAPQVGTPGWNQALGQKVIWMVAGAQQSASLSLNPPDLGPLQVVLNVNNGQADASFYAAQPEVRQALEAALPRLRDMMQDAGVALGQATVSAGMPDQKHAGDASGQGARHGASGRAADSADADPTLPPVRNNIAGSSGQGLVDTFA